MGLYTNIAHASQNFASQMRKKFKLVFRADMCEAKNTSQAFQCASNASARKKPAYSSPNGGSHSRKKTAAQRCGLITR